MKKTPLCLVRDGNLTRLGVALAIVIGLLIMMASLYFFTNQNIRILGASLGLLLVSFGGYAARASTLGLNPFDDSYKKAKASYEKDKSDKPQK